MTDKTQSMTQVSNLPEELVKYMAERFLAWKLPENFHPDCGITAVRPNYAPNVKWEPSGTNLFDYTQAVEMVRYMIEGLPTIPAQDALVGEMRKALEMIAGTPERDPDLPPIYEPRWSDYQCRAIAREALAKLPAPPVVVEGGRS